MKIRSAFVLSTVAVLLGVYIVLFERGPSRPEVREFLFPDLDRQEVREVLLETVGGPVRLVREGTRWSLTRPVQRRADGTRVEDLLREVSTAVVERKLDPLRVEGGSPAAGLGPEAGVRLALLTGEATFGLRLGGEIPGGGRYALRDGESELLVLRDAFSEPPTANAEAWRDRSLLGVSSWDLGSARVVRQGAPALAFARRGQGWWIEQPIEDRADAGRVDTALRDLVALEAVAFVDDEAEDPAVYGLDRPTGRADFFRRSGAEVGTLIFGGRVTGEEDLVYARASGPEAAGEGVVSVRSAALQAFERDAEGWRDRRVLETRSWNVTRLVLVRGGTSVEAVRPDDGGEWAAPAGGPPIDAAAVDALLRDLDEARYLSLVSASEARRAVARLELELDGEETRVVVLTLAERGHGEEAIVAADDRPAAGTLPTSWIERLRPEALLAGDETDAD